MTVKKWTVDIVLTYPYAIIITGPPAKDVDALSGVNLVICLFALFVGQHTQFTATAKNDVMRRHLREHS